MSLSVTFLDCLIVLIVMVSAGYAAWRGFLWETLTIFAWVAAAFACLYFGPYVIPLMRSMVSETWLASLLAYAAVFLAVFIPFAFISHRFSETRETFAHRAAGPGRRRRLRRGARAGDRGLGLSGLHLFRAHRQASGLGHAMRGCCRWCSPPPMCCCRWFPTIPTDFAYDPAP